MIIEMASLQVPFRTPLLFFLLTTFVVFLFRCLGLLSPHAAPATTAKRRGEGKVDVLLRVETDDEGGNIDDLFADTIQC